MAGAHVGGREGGGWGAARTISVWGMGCDGSSRAFGVGVLYPDKAPSEHEIPWLSHE